jgi:hypothetical protein
MPAIAPPAAGTKIAPSTIGRNVAVRKKDTHEQEVSVWDLKGVKHRVPRHQANDFVRHLGWSSTPPKGFVDPDTPPAKEEAAPKADATPPAPKEEKGPDELDLLREQARKAGIEIDNRWGKKRIQEELDKLPQK